MFLNSANAFPRLNQATTGQSSLIERQTDMLPGGQTKGFGCFVFKDHLVLFGSNGERNRNQGLMCTYNLKDPKPENIEMERFPVPMCSCTASLYAIKDVMIFYGAIEASAGGIGNNSQETKCMTLTVKMEKGNGGRGGSLQMSVEHALTTSGSPFSVSHMFDQTLYVYDPSPANDNFGSLKMHSFDDSFKGWQEFGANLDNMRLREPIRHAIFVSGALYILTANSDSPSQTVEAGYSVIEDVYTLACTQEHSDGFYAVVVNEKSGTWKKISSSSDQVPGAMRNVSLAQDNGMIYVFGSTGEDSVLWIFDLGEKEWKQVRDIQGLTARADQKAVVYEGQLLIVDWDYSRNSVKIQNLKLDDLSFVESKRKELCKDNAENLIQDMESLYTGKPFADVIFEVEGEEIPAHKAVLAYRSNYFMKMFNSGMSESHSAKISISNMKSEIFRAILQYIYCNEVELDEQLALGLIPIVDEYLMKGLKEVCEKYLCKQLRKDNVVDMLIVADKHGINDLKKACFRFILKNLGNIDENEEMDKLSKSLFIELLKFSQCQ